MRVRVRACERVTVSEIECESEWERLRESEIEWE